MVDENPSKENKTEYKEIRKLKDGGEYREKFNGDYAYFDKDGNQVGNFRETRTEGSESVTFDGKMDSDRKWQIPIKKTTLNLKEARRDTVFYENGEEKRFETVSWPKRREKQMESGTFDADSDRWFERRASVFDQSSSLKRFVNMKKVARFHEDLKTLHGKQETWRDGVLTDYSTFENGKQVGSYKETDYQDNTHYTSSYGNIKNGKKILTKQEKRDGDRKEVIPYNEDGNIHGRHCVYDKDKLVESSEYQNGQRHGKTENYETGEYATYANDVLHGMSGNTKNGDYSRFKNGEQIGAYQRTLKGPDGCKTVQVGELHPNGDEHIQSVVRYDSNNNLVSSTYYDTDGKKQETEIKDGKAIKYKNNNPVSVSPSPHRIDSGKYDNNGQLQPGATATSITSSKTVGETTYMQVTAQKLDKNGDWQDVETGSVEYNKNNEFSTSTTNKTPNVKKTVEKLQVSEQKSPTVNTPTLKKTGQER